MIALVTGTKIKAILLSPILIGLIACSANSAAPTAQSPAAQPNVRPTATLPPPDQPTQPPSQGGVTSYDDPTAPFTLQYPAGWQVREEPESIFFHSPDQAATIQLIIYEYPEGAPKTTTAKEIFDRFTQNLSSQSVGLKLSNQATRPDGSVYADISYQDSATQNALQGFVRVILAKSRRFHFILLFTVAPGQLARYKPGAVMASDSFRER
jgi:hypothetical protein